MNVAEGPIVETVGVQVSDAAGRVNVVTGRSSQTGMHDAYVDGPFTSSRIFGQQAVRGLWVRKAQTVENDVQTAGCLQYRLSTTAEDGNGVGKHQLFGNPRQGVMIAADLENPDAGLVQACHLRCQKPRSFHRGLLAIV